MSKRKTRTAARSAHQANSAWNSPFDSCRPVGRTSALTLGTLVAWERPRVVVGGRAHDSGSRGARGRPGGPPHHPTS